MPGCSSPGSATVPDAGGRRGMSRSRMRRSRGSGRPRRNRPSPPRPLSFRIQSPLSPGEGGVRAHRVYNAAMAGFQLVSRFTPQGDQPEAIRQLTAGIERGDKEQVLLGITGSGKTYTIAQVIQAEDRPTLVLSHNKTLAAQLFQEFRSFFPHNAVEYFVSYYDYYQPEAYVPATDTYIEKETNINEEIERLRLRATKTLFERRDVIIVASVSCIYGLGSPESFYGMLQFFSRGDLEGMDPVLKRLVDMQYQRTQLDLFHGSFRVRGDVLE